MSKHLRFSILIVILLIFIHPINAKINTKYVCSLDGLLLREYPNIKSRKIGIIGYYEQVNVLKYSDNQETINGIRDRWAFIHYKFSYGWVFAGYLKDILTFYENNVTNFCLKPFLNRNIPIFSNSKFIPLEDTIVKEFGPAHGTNTIFLDYPDIETSDSIKIRNYDLFSFNIYHYNDGIERLMNTVIRSNKEPINMGIKVGDPLNILINKFGYPIHKSGYSEDYDSIIYQYYYSLKNNLVTLLFISKDNKVIYEIVISRDDELHKLNSK
jgi:hypothetical protein